jgi:CCR4-NOT transcriptional complex subunit CAF120
MSRISLPPSRSGTLRFEEPGSASQPGTRRGSPTKAEFDGTNRVDSTPPSGFSPQHQRSVSEANGYRQKSRLNEVEFQYNDQTQPPQPPAHRIPYNNSQTSLSSPDTPDQYRGPSPPVINNPHELPSAAVEAPPAFAHGPGQRPPNPPPHSAELRKANTQMDPATLHQMADATNAPIPTPVAAAGAVAAWKANQDARRSRDYDQAWDNRGQQNLYPEQQSRYHHSPSSSWGGRQQLPTIPASPYIEQDQPIMAPASSYEPSAPPVPEHAEEKGLPLEGDGEPSMRNEYGPFGPTAVAAAAASRPAMPARASSGHSIHRKPIPGRSSISSQGGQSKPSSTPETQSLSSLRSNVIQPEDLDRFAQQEQQVPHQSSLVRQPTSSSSVYDDDASLSSTDYASTESSKTRQPPLPRDVDRPRAGVLKTVGIPQPEPHQVVVGDVHYDQQAPKQQKSDIPAFDFGPTYAVIPDGRGRPSTSGTITPGSQNQSSRSRERLSMAGALGPDGRPQSYYSTGRPHSSHGLAGEGIAQANRSSSASPIANINESNRSVAWQPGMAAHGGHTPKASLTAEEWVQQRAAVANQPRTSPQFGHSHKGSTSPANMSRNSSGDWSAQAADRIHQRTPTSDRIPSRPHSRGASIMMNANSSSPNLHGQQPLIHAESPSLSAREQEYVARATGTPLIQLGDKDKNKQRSASGNSGLVGAIEAREKEKTMKGASPSQVAQNAVWQRQQQQVQQHAAMRMSQQNMGMGMNMAQPGMGYPVGQAIGGYSGSPAVSPMTPPIQQHYQQPYQQPYQQYAKPNPGSPYVGPQIGLSGQNQGYFPQQQMGQQVVSGYQGQNQYVQQQGMGGQQGQWHGQQGRR